jgi:hypothetical protein
MAENNWLINDSLPADVSQEFAAPAAPSTAVYWGGPVSISFAGGQAGATVQASAAVSAACTISGPATTIYRRVTALPAVSVFDTLAATVFRRLTAAVSALASIAGPIALVIRRLTASPKASANIASIPSVRSQAASAPTALSAAGNLAGTIYRRVAGSLNGSGSAARPAATVYGEMAATLFALAGVGPLFGHIVRGTTAQVSAAGSAAAPAGAVTRPATAAASVSSDSVLAGTVEVPGMLQATALAGPETFVWAAASMLSAEAPAAEIVPAPSSGGRRSAAFDWPGVDDGQVLFATATVSFPDVYTGAIPTVVRGLESVFEVTPINAELHAWAMRSRSADAAAAHSAGISAKATVEEIEAIGVALGLEQAEVLSL